MQILNALFLSNARIVELTRALEEAQAELKQLKSEPEVAQE